MKNKHKLYLSNMLYPQDSPQKNTTYPVKSPSPDKNRANIITPTRSPQLNQIQRNITPTKANYRTISHHAGDTSLPDKSSSTRYHTLNNVSESKQFRQYTSNKKQFSDLHNIMPEEFVIGHSRSRSSVKQNELDYIRLLQQKQRTIRQLHQIIDMINRNNNTNTEVLNFSQSEFYDSNNFKNMTLKQSYENVYPKRVTHQSKSQNLVQQLKNQIKILTIENQKLLHLVERQNHSSKAKIQRETQETINLEMANKKISQLRDSLYNKEQEVYQADSHYEVILKKLKKMEEEVKERDQENMKLLKILKQIKDRQQNDRKNQTLKQSSVSYGSGSKVQKQKISLLKIKEQHEQNLNTFKNVVYQQAQAMVDSMQNQIEQLHKNLDKMNLKVTQLQKLILLGSRKQPLDELSQIQMREQQKQRHLQIQSILLQKNQQYQKKLITQRENYQKVQRFVQKLQGQKSILQQNLKQLNQKYLQSSSERAQNNRQQIEDINFRIKDTQIRKLRDLLIQNQKVSQLKISELESIVQNLKQKVAIRQCDISQQKHRYQSKIQSLNEIIEGKSSEIYNIQEYYKQQISKVKISITHTSSLSLEASNQSIENLKKQLADYKILLQECQNKIHLSESELYKKSRQFQISKQSTEEQVRKLVLNYEKEIQMLNFTILNKQQEISGNKSESSRRLQVYETQILFYKQQINTLQGKIHAYVQQNKQIKYVQDQLKVQLQSYEVNMQIKHQNQLSRISQLEGYVKIYQKKIEQLQRQVLKCKYLQQNNQTLSTKCSQLNGQLQICQHQNQNLRKQKQALIVQANTKNIQFLEEVERYQVQREQAQQIIAKLNTEVNQHRQNIHSLRDQNLNLQNNFNEIIKFKKQADSMLTELYQLKHLINQNASLKSKGQKYNLQNYEKLQLEHQSKIQQVKQLHLQIADLRETIVKEKQTRQLIQQKVNFLQKNIAIYQNQLKERKHFCEKLVVQKAKIDRELLYMKKSKIDQKGQETDSLRTSLISRINRLVELQQNRQKTIGYIIQSSRLVSPIKKVQELTTSVYSTRQ